MRTLILAALLATSHTGPAHTGHQHHRQHLFGCRSKRCDHHVGRIYWLRHHPKPSPPVWVIPTAIVMCESGGQNLPPNSAGASGDYQIIPGTWAAYGGLRYAPEAYEASLAQQSIVAARIWDGGRGASQWVCKA